MLTIFMAEAWEELMSAWTSYMAHPTPGTVKDERFPLFMSNAFNGEEGNDCDYTSSSCQSATCNSNGLAPATYLIQNNFNFLWRVSSRFIISAWSYSNTHF